MLQEPLFGLLLVSLVAVGMLAWMLRRRGTRAADDLRRCADITYALDQAAIVATTDVTGRITYANDRFCEISGYAREELLGQDHRLLNSGLHSAAFMQDLWRTIAGGRVWRGELRNRAKDGHFYWVDTTIVPFLNARGKPYQYTAIRHDVTRRKVAEERLREQAALAHVGQMAAVVAHEVKNPLAGIKGVMQVLRGRRPVGDEEAVVMTDIIGRIDALNDLIQDLLLFARPRALKIQSLDLGVLLQKSVEIMRKDPSASEVAMTLDTPRMEMRGDVELLEAAVLNLLINAVQAMDGRGSIVVRASIEGARYRVEVADDGPGVPEEIRARIFEPFFTTKSRGGGLGLPIAARTIDLHGGTIGLECPPGGGTTVAIDLPREPPTTGPDSPGASSA